MKNPWSVSPKKASAGRPKAPWDIDYGFAPEPEYSAVRSGAVDFLESALGVGDELDAAVRLLSGEVDTYNQGIQQSRAELDAFERANPGASLSLIHISEPTRPY